MYKAPGITGTCTFKPFHIYACVSDNKHELSENQFCVIQIISKVFSISVYVKSKFKKPDSYFDKEGGGGG